jgi:hypothetical protein
MSFRQDGPKPDGQGSTLPAGLTIPGFVKSAAELNRTAPPENKLSSGRIFSFNLGKQ